MKNSFIRILCLCSLLLAARSIRANIPGGGTGTGANVTLTYTGNGTVTIANGIVSIVCTTNGATINQINYTYNNGAGTKTMQLLNGGTDGGMLYWETGGFDATASGYFSVTSFTVVANPATNGGSYAEIAMQSASATNGVLEIHFSMLRGSPGFYVTPIWSHRSQDIAMTMGETRDNIYAGSIFNWMSVDAARSRLMEVSGGLAIGVQGAPVEVSLWTNGIYQGQYEDKYKYSADFGDQRVWGWSSVGTGGQNVGIWNVSGSMEYHVDGPLKRDLMEHIGTTILNMMNSSHYGSGNNDASWATGEIWTKVYGPYFIYFNNVTNTLTGTNRPAQALYSDALAQAAAEQGVDTNGQPTGAVGAWPYYWFSNTNYAPASGRGTVTGQIVIADSGNPNASAANLWVGLIQQPSTTDGMYDFQEWMKCYQFWVKTDTNGNFTIPNVIAGTNYTLYTFGPGSPGTFQSQNLNGGNTPNTIDIPATQFSVATTGGVTNDLGVVTWTPTRVGATVFEIGYPDRKGDKFRHGEDYWVSNIGPSPTEPSPIWSKHLEYPFEFPTGVNYVVGQNRWTTDWNYVQPVVVDGSGNLDNSSSTITFNLPTAPANNSTASLYLAMASDYSAAIIIQVNGSYITSTSGFYANFTDENDTTIRQGINGAFSDARTTFAGNLLHAGQNTITISIRQTGGTYFADHAMYDYLRLELTGYVPPAPASVAAYPGNNGNLVCWPVTPGATSYNVLRSTLPTTGFSSITNGVTGPVCGSGTNNAVWLDNTAVNGTTYYYEVQSVNPTGTSATSPASSAVTPTASYSTSAPAPPAGLSVTATGHQSVAISWTGSANADFYSIWRSTLVNTGGGSSNILGTIILNNTNTTTRFTDTTPTDGSIYQYFVTATGSGGTSASSPAVVAVPLPTAPSSLPLSLVGSFQESTNVVLIWTAVPGAMGYLIARSTNPNGPFTFLQSVTETNYTDVGLSATATYYYRVTAVNATGVSTSASDSVNGLQIAPASLSAAATNAQIALTWPATTGATGYTILRGTTSGGETTTVISGYSGTSYTNTGLANGTTYYYVVRATSSGGTSGNSPEASATPFATTSGIWTATASGNWGTAANWSGGAIPYGPASTADFSTLTLATNLTVTLDSARTIGTLKFGSLASSFGWTLAGGNTLTLGTSPTVNVVNQTASISTVLAGSTGLAKTGIGALTLGGATNTFTGGLSASAGSLTLDFTATNSPTANLVPAGNTLTLGGGTLKINGRANSASSQAFAATALNAGGSVISAAPVSGTNVPMVSLAGFTANAGGVVEFIGAATIGSGGAQVASNADLTTTASGTGAFVGGSGAFSAANFATVGLYDFAAAGTTSPYVIMGGSQVSGFYTTASGTAPSEGNVDVLGNITGYSGEPYLTTMRFNTSIGANITFANYGGTLTLADILVTPNVGAYNVTFPSGGNLRPSSGGPTPMVLWQNNPGGELIINGTIGNSKSGTSFYTQTGPGTVLLNNTVDGYTGPSYLNGGITLIAGNGALGPAATAAAVSLNGGTVMANATFALDNGGINARPVTLLGNGGGLAATAGNTLTVDGVIGSAGSAGPLTIGVPASSANENVPALLPGTGAGTANATPVYATGTVALTNANYYTGGTLLQSGILNINGINSLGGANYGGLTLNGGTLQYAANLTGNNGSGDLTSTGTAGITVAAGGGTIDVNGNSITCTGSVGNNGSGALTIKSSLPNGVLTFQGANTYAGATLVTNVTLGVDNTSGSATGSGNVTVLNNGVLAGTGTVGGSVTVTAGGTLAPGNALAALTFNNNLTLAAGATTVIQVQHSPLANSVINVAGTFIAGGTLMVTNPSLTTLAAGDSFPLFNVQNYSGGFASLVLPPLSSGLIWNTNYLATGGTLSVAAVTQPVFAAVSLTSDGLVFQGSAGLAGANFYLLGSTNLAAPLINWTPLYTNQFDNNGNFNFTNLPNPNSPQSFYLLQVP